MADKILFVVPPNITFEDFVTPPSNISTITLKNTDGRMFGSVITDIPLGIISLSAYVKAYVPVEVMAVDYNVELTKEPSFDFSSFQDYFRQSLTRQTFQDFAPTVVCISAQFTPAYQSVIDLAEISREAFAGAQILVGGNLPTAMYKDFLADSPAIDAVCYGEGELPLVDLLKVPLEDRARVLAENNSWVTRDKLKTVTGDACGTFTKAFIENLDEIPFLDYDILDLEGYKANPTLARYSVTEVGKEGMPIMTSRGCPFRCTFCASHNAHGREMRYYSVERVKEDLHRLIDKYKVTSLIVQDDHFMGGRERPYQIVEAVRELGVSIFFQNALAIYALDRRFLELLKSAGVNEVVLPIESGSERVLRDVMKKPLKLSLVNKVTADCRDIGLYTDCNIILGMPGETKQDIADAREYLKTIYGDWFRVFVATPIPGSEMYEQAMAKNLFKVSPLKANYKRAVLETEHMTAEDVQQTTYLMNIELNFVFNSNMRLGRWDVALDSFEGVLRVKPDHALAFYYGAICLDRLGRTAEADKYFAEAVACLDANPHWNRFVEEFSIPIGSGRYALDPALLATPAPAQTPQFPSCLPGKF
jgi:radical SAM superfamily enzyme YgiQ (UPF0313 family)